MVIPLCIIYEKFLATGKFPEIWKKANVLPFHKKEGRQIKIIINLFLYYLPGVPQKVHKFEIKYLCSEIRSIIKVGVIC